MTDTKEVTLYLRGLAVSAVLVNHYVNDFVSRQFPGYAFGIISIFFVVSGYGIFHSLQKSFAQNQTKLLALLKYFYKRAIRILPLYWLAFLLASYFFFQSYSMKTFSFIPLHKFPGDYFLFVTLILQCYVASPFLYFFLTKFGERKFAVLVTVFILLGLLCYFFISLPHSYYIFYYRSFFLGHISLFALGMLIPSLVLNEDNRNTNKYLTVLFFLLFVTAVYYTRQRDMLFLHSAIYLLPLFIISSFVFCLFFISVKPSIPLRKPIILIGTYSYSVYLLHHFYYEILARLGIIKYASLLGLVLTILLFPVFLLICAGTEKTLKKTTELLGKLSRIVFFGYGRK